MKTPQTDDLARGNHVVPTEWAEQLERERDQALIDRANGDIATMTTNHYERVLRERDEAREEIEALRHEYHGAKAMAGGFKDKIKSLREQRDEAREKYDNLATEHMLAINKLCNERDEAREIAQQLIHIASHCLGWHDNPETITEAIKRWNASTK